MVAIGAKAFLVRPDMPGAAGCYAALERLHSSLAATEGELKAIEDDIGPVWRTGGVSLGATKRPLLLVGAAAGGLLLLCLLWKLLAASLPATGLLGSGYEVDYKEGGYYRAGWLDITVRGKAAKLAVILTDPHGETETAIIEEDRMITNSAAVSLALRDPPGTYALTVKTFVPEGVVFKKEFWWPPRTQVAGKAGGAVPAAAELPREKPPAYDEPLPR